MWIRTHQTNRSPTAGVNMNRVAELRIHDLHISSGEWELVAYFDHMEATEGTLDHSQCRICQGAREDVEFKCDWLLDQLDAQSLPVASPPQMPRNGKAHCAHNEDDGREL